MKRRLVKKFCARAKKGNATPKQMQYLIKSWVKTWKAADPTMKYALELAFRFTNLVRVLKHLAAELKPHPKLEVGGVVITHEEAISQTNEFFGLGRVYKLPNLTLNEVHNPTLGAHTPTAETES